MLVRTYRGEMFRLTEFDAIRPEFLHELKLVLIGLGLERRGRLAVIAEHGRKRAERVLPAANQLSHRRPCRRRVARLLHARHGNQRCFALQVALLAAFA